MLYRLMDNLADGPYNQLYSNEIIGTLLDFTVPTSHFTLNNFKTRQASYLTLKLHSLPMTCIIAPWVSKGGLTSTTFL